MSSSGSPTDRLGDALKVVVVIGHPRASSLCHSLAAAYVEGARSVGVDVNTIDLAELFFDPDVKSEDPRDQPLEPCLAAAKAAIVRANHLVFVFPTWWSTYPAKLAGFLDRILLPGFAFRLTQSGMGHDGLLAPRTAELITTMDTPRLIHALIYRRPGLNALTRGTLGYCGIDVVRTTQFAAVVSSIPAERSTWLAVARDLGERLRNGPRSRLQLVRKHIGNWLAAMRLQFYPMTLAGYTLGACMASSLSGNFAVLPYCLGLLAVVFAEAATVFINDVIDFPTDSRNQLWGPFTGGSRVLVDGRLAARDLQLGAATAAALSLLSVLAVSIVGPRTHTFALLLTYVVQALMALGYTLPPLKLCYRGLGELDVAITHSIGVVLMGYLVQGGAPGDGLPWLAALPILLAVLPGIVMAGIPDLEADRRAGKRTWAVRLGYDRALLLAALLAPTSFAAVLVLLTTEIAPLLAGLALLAGAHGFLLTLQILFWRRRHLAGGRIDRLMASALLLVIWPVAIPLVHLLLPR